MIKKMKVAVSLLLTVCILCAMLCGCMPQQVINSDKTMKVQLYWDVNFTNNYYCGVTIQPITYFMMEGLYHRLDTVDYVTPVLADGMPEHSADGLTTTIHIKEAAKWQNGEDFTAQDVWAFYMMQHTTVTNYMLSIDPVDAKTIEIHWNPNKTITNDVKDKLLALDLNGSIKYNEYKEYVDEAARLLNNCKDADLTKTTSTPFGKEIDVDTSVAYNVNYSKFQVCDPVTYAATGPFIMTSYSATQMVLEKNPNYWAADQVKFEKIICYNFSDTNQIYNALVNNEIYYYDGVPEENVLNSLIGQNSNLIHLKMLDIATVGINFNLSRPVWQDIRVREAMQYIFDRDEIKNLANPYAITNYYASTTMPASEISKHVSQEHQQKLTKHTEDHAKAEALLTEAGWTKVNGKWHDATGAEVEIVMASSSSHPIWNGAAVAAQAQLQSFGITCNLKLTDQGSMYVNGQSESSPYDCVVMWTELNDTLSHPYGSFNSYKQQFGYFTHMPRFNRGDAIGINGGTAYAGDINMEFDWVDGGVGPNGRKQVNYSEYLNSLYSLDGALLEEITASIVVGMSKQYYGVNFFQNVTGGVWNKGMVGGIGLQDRWTTESNLTYIPDITTQDAISMAQMNLHWSKGTTLILGLLYPETED